MALADGRATHNHYCATDTDGAGRERQCQYMNPPQLGEQAGALLTEASYNKDQIAAMANARVTNLMLLTRRFNKSAPVG